MAENNYAKSDENVQGYTHIAFADSSDGTQGFTTSSNGAGKGFVGCMMNNSAEDSHNPSDYTWSKLVNSPRDEPGPAGEEGVPVEPGHAGEEGVPAEPKPNIGNKRIPKWLQWVVVIMVTGSIGFNFAGLAIGVALWFVFDWINGDL